MVEYKDIKLSGETYFKISLSFPGSMPQFLIFFGMLGGVIFVLAVILILTLCRRNFVKAKKLGSGLVSISTSSKKKKQTKSTSTSASTSSTDETSSDLKDLKVDVRTASSLSERNQDDWDGSDEDFKPSVTYRSQPNRSSSDYVDSSTIPRSGYDPQYDGQFYTNNLIQASRNYYPNAVANSHIHGNGYATNPHRLAPSMPVSSS